MTAATHPHAILLEQVRKEFAGIFAQTTQGVYVYLDDSHWICNERMATLLGYASTEELIKASTSPSLLAAIVTTESQQHVVEAYSKAVEGKAASSVPVIWKKKGGGTVKTQTIFAPISFGGTILALHFITPI